MKSSISVIVPAYNEESRILPTLDRLCEYLKGRFREFEIIIFDDGSADDTASVVKTVSLKRTFLRGAFNRFFVSVCVIRYIY